MPSLRPSFHPFQAGDNLSMTGGRHGFVCLRSSAGLRWLPMLGNKASCSLLICPNFVNCQHLQLSFGSRPTPIVVVVRRVGCQQCKPRCWRLPTCWFIIIIEPRSSPLIVQILYNPTGLVACLPACLSSLARLQCP